METKKSLKADLERTRPQRFAIGLVVALSSLFVALEYSFSPDDPLDDPELLEQLTIDEELSPLLRPENELALAPKAEPAPTVKLKVVDDELNPEEEEELEQQPDAPTEGDTADALPEPDEEQKTDNDDEVLSLQVVEDIPQFPGGPTEFMKWLTRNLKYPAVAQQHRTRGKVVAQFIVNKDGSVTDVRIVGSLSPTCDNEALRVLRMMPRWQAGLQNGKPCRTMMCIPIVFRL